MSAALRRSVRKRASARCEYCRLPDLAPHLMLFHPDTGRVVRLFNPRRDAWTRHFVWEGLRIGSITAKGPTTAWLLEFNSDERLKLRHGLRKLGLF